MGMVAVVVLLLATVYTASKLTGEVKWGPFDFIVAGILLLGTGLAIEFDLRKVQKTTHRIAFCVGILFVLFVIWAELAVGLIGTPLAGS